MKQWQKGRQGTGYYKYPIISLPFFDCYLLKYKEGSYIPSHRDSITNKRHFRLNIVIQEAIKGGQFVCEKSILSLRRISLFRPDRYYHQVTKIIRGTRYVLSFGFAL